ncbi:phage portal protein [Apilactobacillus timberlakei]|uniref:Phage portal protein n=2 Tax=Apilactobacillus timberlakei TaxID=2008380 RepID=A0ABY2YRG1_9LACO|nr:phage portal protein [Apilactobacillus timberlakei]TPR13630.1 phage portal protein [Apilactobacillus timberlakei]
MIKMDFNIDDNEHFNMQDFMLPGTPINSNVNIADSFTNSGKMKLGGNAYIDDNDVFIYPKEMNITGNMDDLYTIINYHEQFILPKYQMKSMYYKGRHDRIIEKDDAPKGKPDSRLIINFPKKLIDTFNGFCNFGKVQVSDTNNNNEINNTIQQWLEKSDFDDLITELSKLSDIYGRAYLYVFDNGQDIEIAPCSPMDTIVVYDDTVKHNPMFAIRYSNGNNGYSGTVITPANDYTFDTNNTVGSAGKNLKVDSSSDKGIGISNTHDNFPFLPVLELKDNEERIGLMDDVINLVDSVNETISNKTNDTDSFKNSYLFVSGTKMDSDQVTDMNQHNFINLYPTSGSPWKYDGQNGVISPSVSFISPTPNDEMQENTLNRNIDLIYQISQIVDMNDSKLGSNMSNISGTALFQRYQTMQSKANTKAKKLKSLLRQLFSILFAYKHISEDAYALSYSFNFNVPHNVIEETQAFSNVFGKIPNENSVQYLKSLSNKQEIIQKMQQMKEQSQQVTANASDKAISDNKGDK